METDKPNLFYMKFCPKDFVSDTNVAAMTISERGAYIMLLCYCWMADEPGFLKDDDKLLAKLSGAGRSWSKVKDAVKGAFKCNAREGYLCQTRILSEYNSAVAETAQNKANGLKGAQKRWGGHSPANSPPNGDPNSEAIASYSNSNSNSQSNKEEDKSAAKAVVVPKELKSKPKPTTHWPHVELILPNSMRTSEMETAWLEWEVDKKRRGSKITPGAATRQANTLSSLGTVSAAIATIDHSISGGYAGLFPPKDNGAAEQRVRESRPPPKPTPKTAREVMDLVDCLQIKSVNGQKVRPGGVRIKDGTAFIGDLTLQANEITKAEYA